MNVPRDAGGKILPGASLNPAGRPRGAVSGRSRALELVDQVLTETANIQCLEKALSKALREKPLWFFVNIVMPLLPKETKGVLEAGDRIVEWRGLLSVGAGSASPLPVPVCDAGFCAAPGGAGDAGFVHARETATADEAPLPFSPAETPPL